MNVLMLTNTYKPFVGGVERSVDSFSSELRRKGHRVLIVAPEFDNQPEKEVDVVRLPSIKNFKGTKFSVSLPIPGILEEEIKKFKPDIVHTHHPFLLGDSGFRVAVRYKVPLVFTYHTLYECYAHYFVDHPEAVHRFIVDLCCGYANLCDHVITPTKSVLKLLVKRDVTSPMTVIPTGVNVEKFKDGCGKRFRESYGIPDNHFVFGLVSRIAPEKNIDFLKTVVVSFLKKMPQSTFLLVGEGPSLNSLKSYFADAGLSKQVVCPGTLKDHLLVDSYHAMDLFVFCSKTETQGIVLAEAMSAGVPVLAIDASGSNDIVRHKENGYLCPEKKELFLNYLIRFYCLSDSRKADFKEEAKNTADAFSLSQSVDSLLHVYEDLKNSKLGFVDRSSAWDSVVDRLKTEWKILKNIGQATTNALEK